LVLLSDTTGLLTGEENVSVQGVSVAIQRETQRQRQVEFLQSTANPIDMGIIGIKGRGAVLRSVAQTIGLDGDEIVPSDDDLEKLQQQQQGGGEQQALAQKVEAGVQQGVQMGVQKIASDLTAGLLASQAGVPAGQRGILPALTGGAPLGPLGAPGSGALGGGMDQMARAAQGNQPSPLSQGNTMPTSLVGNQPAPPGPGARPPVPMGGPPG
jgi:hypothetical protein